MDQYNVGTRHDYQNPYASQQTYDDMGPGFDPYSAAYDNELNQPYNDSNPSTQGYSRSQRLPSTRIGQQQPPIGAYIGDANRNNNPIVAVAPLRKEGSGFDRGEFTPITPRCAVTLSLRSGCLFILGEIDQLVP